MYRCKECGNLFEYGEEQRWVEPHGETFSGCPICYGPYEVAMPCKMCGGYSDEDVDYCETCKNDIKQRFVDLLDKNFTEEERDLLNELYDGERL